jgi:hypothetical protein
MAGDAEHQINMLKKVISIPDARIKPVSVGIEG